MLGPQDLTSPLPSPGAFLPRAITIVSHVLQEVMLCHGLCNSS